jgi:hypothetical protein
MMGRCGSYWRVLALVVHMQGLPEPEIWYEKTKISDQKHNAALAVDSEQLRIVPTQAVLPPLKTKFAGGSTAHAWFGLLLRISLERNAERPMKAYSSVVPSLSRSTGTLSIVAQAGPLPVRGIHSILTDVPHCVTSKFPRTLP